MCCNSWEKCTNNHKISLGCSTPLKLTFDTLYHDQMTLLTNWVLTSHAALDVFFPFSSFHLFIKTCLHRKNKTIMVNSWHEVECICKRALLNLLEHIIFFILYQIVIVVLYCDRRVVSLIWVLVKYISWFCPTLTPVKTTITVMKQVAHYRYELLYEKGGQLFMWRLKSLFLLRWRRYDLNFP